MINYRKSLLSVATCLALATSSMASSYLPLTSETKDDRWVLFGVNGLKSESTVVDAVSATLETTSVGGWTQITDSTTSDTLAVSGLSPTHATSDANDMATLRATDAAITLAVDLTDKSFSATEPTRTMYIDSEDVDVADVILTYKASLEGSLVEFTVDGGSVVYQATINASNTFSNPASRTLKAGTDGSSETDQLTEITDIIDYNLLDNPNDPSSYVLADHLTDNTSSDVRMYSYDSTSSSWKIYDNGNSKIANDFDTIKEGKAYWAKIDVDGSGGPSSATKAGLVLGNSGLADTDYDGELVEGWNLISFDDANPDLRTSSTGLILTIDNSVGTNIEIYDATGVNEVTVTLSSGGTTQVNARLINSAIEGAKSRGDIPDTFDLKAFRVSATEVALISNKKFSVKDSADDDDITGVTTLTGSNAYSLATNALAATAAIDSNGFSSVYGEYMLMINPLIGEAANLEKTSSDTATDSAGSEVSASIQVNSDRYNLRTAANTVSALDQTAANLTFTSADTSKEYKAIEIDIDFDGTTDRLLLSAQERFYIKDHTFTRVYEFDVTNIADANTIQLAGAPINATIDPATSLAATVDLFNEEADKAADATSVFAKVEGTKLLLVSASADATGFNMFDHASSEFLKDSTLSTDIAKGAVKEVYAVNTVAKQAVVTHKVEIDLTAVQVGNVNEAGDTLKVNINGGALSADITAISTVSSTATRLAMFDALVSAIEAEVISAGIDATVLHDYTESADDVDAAVITIEGHGITAATIDFVDATGGTHSATYTGVDANILTAGMLSGETGKLVSDLKYNAVYSPDFVSDGPLYTLKSLGYTAQAIVTGSTQMSDGAISWTNIDLTESASDWFKDQDYNLFSIDGKAGYWTYLVENANDPISPSNDLTISSSVLTPSYISHFNSDTGGSVDLETANLTGANISVTVDGLGDDKTTTRVYANVGGSDVELVNDGTDNVYTATITSYEVDNLAGNADVTISVSDGIGWSLEPTSIGSIDLDKPLVPSVTQNRGDDVVIASSSDDVVNYNVYTNSIDESTAATSTFDIVAAADAAAYNLCGVSSALAFGTQSTFRVIALDGGGAISTGNASDAKEFNYTPTIKGAQLLTHQYLAGSAEDAVDLAEGFDSSCVSTGVATSDSGVSLKSVIENQEVKMTYVKVDNAVFNTDKPNTFYVEIGAGAVLQIQYVSAYAGDTFFVEIGSVVYEGSFPAAGDTTNSTTSSPMDVSGSVIQNQNL